MKSSMLLNEFLKEHRKNEEQEATMVQLKKGMEVLTAQVQKQSDLIQKLSLEAASRKPAAQKRF